jgi:hypothetical protein
MTSRRILALMALMNEIKPPAATYWRAVRRATVTLTDSDENDAAQARGNAALLEIEQHIRRWVAKQPAGLTAALTEAERTMLAHALGLAQDRILTEDGYTDEDQAAVTSLRRLLTAAQPTPAPAPPAADRAGLRDRIAEAFARYDWNVAPVFRAVTPNTDHYGLADAMLAVLPPAADRATVLREAADALTAVIAADKARFPARSDGRAALGGAREIVLGLIGEPGTDPTPADRAAVLREAIDRLDTRVRQAPAPGARLHSFGDVARVLTDELRRMAGGAQSDPDSPTYARHQVATADGTRP